MSYDTDLQHGGHRLSKDTSNAYWVKTQGNNTDRTEIQGSDQVMTADQARTPRMQMTGSANLVTEGR